MTSFSPATTFSILQEKLFRRPAFWIGLLVWMHMTGVLVFSGRDMRFMDHGDVFEAIFGLLIAVFIVIPPLLLFTPFLRGAKDLSKRVRRFMIAALACWLLAPIAWFLLEIILEGPGSAEGVYLTIPFSFFFAPYITLYGLISSERDLFMADGPLHKTWLLHLSYWLGALLIFAPLLFAQRKLSSGWLRFFSLLGLLFVVLTLRGCSIVTVCASGC